MRDQRNVAVALGHVAVYARDGRWRRSVAQRLEEAGHSHCEAALPEELRRLLVSQRFDVLALNVRDAEDARGLAAALEGVTLPPHSVVAGRGGGRLLALRQPAGMLRYVPGPVPASEVGRLVDVSMSAGPAEDGGGDHGAAAELEEVDVEELIEGAAAAVYAQAKRKQQRFSSRVEGPVVQVLAHPVRVRRAVVALLRLCVALAPRGALVSVEARGGADEWSVQMRASNGRGASASPGLLANPQGEEARVLRSLSREVQQQGGLLWTELLAPAGLALCLSLPLANEEALGLEPLTEGRHGRMS